MPIVDDLQEVAPLLGGERGKAPVVEDQQLGARQTLEEPCIAPITAGERERIEQPGQAMVEDRASSSRQALWPSARAIQLLPTPVGPMTSKYVPPPAKAITDAGGKYVVRGGRTVAIFGEPPKPRIAVMGCSRAWKRQKPHLILLPIKKPRRWETNTRNSAFMPWEACCNSWSYPETPSG